MGQKKKSEHPILNEAVWSLPGLHRPTNQQPPEDLSPEDWVEVSTGEDTPRVVSSLGSTLLGLLFWGLWAAWTIYIWFFTGTPLTDLWILLLVWALTFVTVVVGVPVSRRKTRVRANQ